MASAVGTRLSSRSSASLPSLQSTWRPRSQCKCQNNRQSRSFSQTSPANVTAARETFYNWLATTGKKFKRPLPGSTNYMSAYGRNGMLMRALDAPAGARPGKESGERSGAEDAASEQDPARKETEARLQKAADEDSARSGRSTLPTERPSDMKPFRLNPAFRSQSVLAEELREAIYLAVMEENMSIREASTHFQVTMERVAAVVRMKQMERDWIKQAKPIAASYSKQVLSMLPQTRLNRQDPIEHESINDLPVHPATTQQIFYPVSESRAFTRDDAGQAFRAGLLPADKRIPHPQLIALARAQQEGMSRLNRDALRKKLELDEIEAQRLKKERQQRKEEREVKTVAGKRWNFKFQDISTDAVGQDGRSRSGVGWRYGMPHEDRKPGQVKIPTSVA